MHPTADEAIALQERLGRLVDPTDHDPRPPRYVAGLDVAYDGDEYAAAVVVLEPDPAAGQLREVDRAVVRGRTSFPYPGCSRFARCPGYWPRWSGCE